MGCRLDHIVLNVREIEASLRFYVGLIGLAVERLEEFRRGELPFPSVRINDDTIIDLLPEGLWSSGSEEPPGQNMNHFCLAFERSEWDGIRARLEEVGVSIEGGPMVLSGARGNGTAIYVLDPDGNRVEIRYYDE